MPVFLCRWPNGDFSLVAAPHKAAAIEELDEVANAEGAPMRRMPPFQAHFRLSDDGELVLEQFGEATIDAIMSFCYPLLESAREENLDRAAEEGRDADPDAPTSEEQARIAAAVRRERERVKPAPGPTPRSLEEEGRAWKKKAESDRERLRLITRVTSTRS